MKKLLLACMMALGVGTFAQTNVASYSFVKSTGVTYTPITGGTKLFPSGTNTTYDDEVSAAIPLSSPFTFGGVAMNSVYVSANGFITFGAAPGGTNYTPLSTLGTTTGAISAFGQDGGFSSTDTTQPPGNHEISYQDLGTEFVVQWQDHANFRNRSTERLNFQIRLVYSTGEIKIIYGNCTDPGTSSTTSTTPQVGIRGNSTTFATNVSALMIGNVPIGTSCDWSKAVTGDSNASTMLFSGTTNVNVKIPNGLQYSWTPSTQLPVRTFAATTAITANGATINWTAPTGATAYNVQYRALGSCDWIDFTGNPVSTTTASISGLVQNTTYQVRVQALNGGVQAMYSHIPNLSGAGNGYTTAGSFTTLPNCTSTVTGLTSSAITPDAATISWTASTTPPGNGYEYYYSTSTTAPLNTATPSGSTTAGVISANLTGLTPNTTYNYWVRANCNGVDKGVWSSSASFTTPSLCPTITAPAAGAIGVSTTPTITWTAINGVSGYKLNVGTTSGGNDIVNNADVSGTSYTFASPLNTATKYYYTVSGYTANTNAITCTVRDFTTVCSALIPSYTNNFATFPGLCWTLANGGTPATGPGTGTTNYWVEDGFLNSGFTGAAKINLFSNNRNGWMISPAFDLSAGGYRLKFNFGATNFAATSAVTSMGADDLIQFVVSTDGGTTWTVLQTWNNSNIPSNTSNTYILNLTSYTGNNTKFAFFGSDGTVDDTPDYEFFIDNFIVETIPACDTPTALLSSSVTATGATISWTAPTAAPSNGYDVYYSTTNTAPTASTTPSVPGVMATSTSITLSSMSTYYAWVRSNCGGTQSSWVGPISFTPPPANDNCSGAIALTTGGTFAQNAVSGTIAGSTNTPALTASCLFTPTNVGGNVWYTVTVPASGNLTIETDAVTGSPLTDTVLSVFTDCGTTTSVACDDDTGNGNFSKITLTGQTPGATLFVSVWKFSTATDGAFQISAYDSSLVLATNEIKDAKNNIKVYPNPFNDVLNISDASNVRNVLVTDLSGRLIKTIANPGSQLQLGELKQGMYLVTLEMKDGSKQTLKTIKK